MSQPCGHWAAYSGLSCRSDKPGAGYIERLERGMIPVVGRAYWRA